MEPQIRFCRSTDGTRIAYATIGDHDGLPVVSARGFGWVMDTSWTYPWSRSTMEVIARHRRAIEYDQRGTGGSLREVADLSLEAQVIDLSAVIDALRLDRFDLIGWVDVAPVAVSYAAQNPDRVSRMVLCSPLVATAETTLGSGALQLARMIRTDWSLARRALATLFHSSGDVQRWYSRTLRDSTSQEIAARYQEEFIHGLNITAQLEQVKAPTLVLHFSENGLVPLEASKDIATTIPDARFVPLQGDFDAFGERFENLVLPFLDEGREAPRPEFPSGTSAILFADIADSTALTERLGDDAFRAKARELDAALRAVIRENDGTPIEGKLLGDGVLAVFTGARHAIEAALACGRAGDEAGLPLHLGLHAGDVIREENNVYGGAVNIAARISALAAPGEVLVSQTVRDLARTSAGVAFEERGERELKGVSEPVRVWAVATREEA